MREIDREEMITISISKTELMVLRGALENLSEADRKQGSVMFGIIKEMEVILNKGGRLV